MRFLLIIIGISALLFAGCAKANNPSQPGVMELVKAIPTVGNAIDIDVSTDRIYVAEEFAGVSIIKRSDNSKVWYSQVMGQDGTVKTLYDMKHIAAVDRAHKLFMNEISGADEIQIIDTSNLEYGTPDTLFIVGTIQGGTGAIQDMRFAPTADTTGEYSLTGYFVNTKFFNFGRYYKPANSWKAASSIVTPSLLSGCYMVDDKYFLAAKQRGLIICQQEDESDQCIVISQLDLPGEATKIVVAGNYAYIACRQAGLQIVNISNLTQPRLVYSFSTSSFATSVDVEGKYCMIGTGSGGVYLFDISNPEKARFLEHNTDAGYANDVVINNHQAIIGTRDKGVLIYNLP